MTLQVEARTVTHNSTVDLDDPVRRRVVAPQPRPPLLEGGSIIGVRRSERRHPLTPVVHDPVTIVVPGNKGALLLSGRGVLIGDVNIQ